MATIYAPPHLWSNSTPQTRQARSKAMAKWPTASRSSRGAIDHFVVVPILAVADRKGYQKNLIVEKSQKNNPLIRSN